MLLKLSIIVFAIIIQYTDAKTLNIIVNHRHHYEVLGEELQTHIRLPNIHERALRLDIVSLGHVQPGSYFDKNVTFADDFNETDYDEDLRVQHYDEYYPTDDDFDKHLDHRHEYEPFDNDEDENSNSEFEPHLNGGLIQLDDINSDEIDLDSVAGLNKLYRKKRSAEPEVMSRRRSKRRKRAAQEQWRESLPGFEPASSENDEPDHWMEVTEDDLVNGRNHRYKLIGEYTGMTLLSVVFFVFLGVCFIRDPMAFILAFGTGCPCCLICCPCFRAFYNKYSDTKRLVRENVNRYMPGVIMKDDGTLDYYEPTFEEIEIMHELIEEASGESIG